MMLSLQRVDPELALALQQERDAFDQATIVGSCNAVENLGASVCRGFAAATKAMETAGAPDTAYLLGADPVTGFKLAIGMSKGSAACARHPWAGLYFLHARRAGRDNRGENCRWRPSG
jgi:hypothetical protein